MNARVRRLQAEDAPAYRVLRLEGLRLHPTAFASAVEEEQEQPLAWFASRLAGGCAFGGEIAGELAGIASLVFSTRAKLRHKAALAGVYVRPDARGTGLARDLLAAVLDHAAGRVEAVRLGVSAANPVALQLYLRHGFVEYGREPNALRVGGQDWDEVLMERRLTA